MNIIELILKITPSHLEKSNSRFFILGGHE